MPLSQFQKRNIPLSEPQYPSFKLKYYNPIFKFNIPIAPLFLPPASAVKVIESVPCFCLSVCQFVSAVTAEPLSPLNRLAYGPKNWYEG